VPEENFCLATIFEFRNEPADKWFAVTFRAHTRLSIRYVEWVRIWTKLSAQSNIDSIKATTHLVSTE
jgi:hypothetical protein